MNPPPVGDVDPRVARTREVVLAATRDALVEEGHAGVTIDGISRRSGVARTTIYRHWPELGDLLADAYDSIKPDADAPPPDTGSLREDCRRQLRTLREALRSSLWGHVLPTMLDCAVRRPELSPHQERLVCERRKITVALVERGIDRGELPAGTDAEAVVDRLVSPLFYRHLMSKMPVTDDYLDELVDAVIAGAAATGPTAAGPTAVGVGGGVRTAP